MKGLYTFLVCLLFLATSVPFSIAQEEISEITDSYGFVDSPSARESYISHVLIKRLGTGNWELTLLFSSPQNDITGAYYEFASLADAALAAEMVRSNVVSSFIYYSDRTNVRTDVMNVKWGRILYFCSSWEVGNLTPSNFLPNPPGTFVFREGARTETESLQEITSAHMFQQSAVPGAGQQISLSDAGYSLILLKQLQTGNWEFTIIPGDRSEWNGYYSEFSSFSDAAAVLGAIKNNHINGLIYYNQDTEPSRDRVRGDGTNRWGRILFFLASRRPGEVPLTLPHDSRPEDNRLLRRRRLPTDQNPR